MEPRRSRRVADSAISKRRPEFAMIFEKPFTKVANKVAHAAGLPATFVICCAAIVIWAVTGPVFGFSDTWQLIVNTATTIITFLMVFLIQNTQNRDAKATELKLDELIRAIADARNQFIGAELEPEELLDREKKEIEAEKDRPSPAPRPLRTPAHNGKPHDSRPQEPVS
jgi:low affinity Fe/Cu permease